MASALHHRRPSRRALDPVALGVALTAADSGLSRRGMAGLTKLRHHQIRIMQGSRGAFVKIEPRKAPPLLDLAQIGCESPLTPDYHSLLALQLIGDFPERAPGLRAILLARRTGMSIHRLVEALWHEDGRQSFVETSLAFMLDPNLLAGTLWVALKPLYESVASAFARHYPIPDGARECPVCGGPPWATCGARARCAICESVWLHGLDKSEFRPGEGTRAEGARRVYDSHTGRRLFELDETLFEHAFDPGPAVELFRLLSPRAPAA